MNFLRNTAITLGSNVVIALLGVLTGALLARTLGPYGRGLITTVMIWPAMLAWVGGLSLGFANIYYGSSCSLARRGLFANSFWAALALGTLVGVAASFILPHYIPLTPIQHTLFTIALWLLPLGLWTDYAATLLNSTSRFDRLGFVRIISPLLTGISLLVLWKMNALTVMSAVLTYWAGSCLQFAVTLRYLADDGCISFKPDFPLLYQSFSYALKMHIGTLFAIGNLRLDQLIMTAVVAPKALGLYAFSVTLSEMLRQIATSVTTVLYPKMSGNMSDEDRGVLAARTTRWMLIVVSLSAILLYVFAPWVVLLVGGQRFVEAIPVVRILLPGTVALCVGITMATSLRGVGKPGVTTTAEGASLIVMLILLWLLLPRMGIYGAGLAAMGSYSAYCFVTAYYFRKIFGKDSLYNVCPTVQDWHYFWITFRQLRSKPQPAIVE